MVDEAWWNRRTLVAGCVGWDAGSEDADSQAAEARPHWIRWRFVDELLKRFYVDYGLEPGFGYLGVELYNVALWSPHCRRKPRYFGRLCPAGDFHPEDDTNMLHDVCPSLAYAGLVPEVPREHTDQWWPSWAAYLRDGIEALGLASGAVAGHEACFHRRGKSLLPLIYRVALLLRVEGQLWKKVSPQDGRSVYSYPPRGGSANLDEQRVSFLIPPGDHPIASYLVVSRKAEPVAALRTDGVVTTRMGEIDAGALWRGGASEQEVAAAISERIPKS